MIKTIKLNTGRATLGGRVVLPQKLTGKKRTINVYFCDKDEYTYSTGVGPPIKVLVPTKDNASNLVSSKLSEIRDGGIESIVVHVDVWDKIKFAEDVEIFNHSTNLFAGDEQPSRMTEESTETKFINPTETVLENKKENKKMNIDSTKTMVTQAAADGAKLAGANKFNGLIVSACSKALEKAGVPSELAEAEMAQTIAKIVGPILIHYLAESQGERIDGLLGDKAAARIQEGCKYATQAATVDIMEPLMGFLLPLLKELASSGLNSIMSGNEETGPSLVETDEIEVAV